MQQPTSLVEIVHAFSRFSQYFSEARGLTDGTFE